MSNVNGDRCLILDNVFDGTVEREDVFYLSVRNDLHEGSGSCGQTHQIHVDRECGRVYMRFDCARTADKAAVKWHQTTYKGNVIYGYHGVRGKVRAFYHLVRGKVQGFRGFGMSYCIFSPHVSGTRKQTGSHF